MLLGHRDAARWQLQRIWPCCNTWPERAERDRRFAIDPREQLVAQRWARLRGWQVLGVAHSHPTSGAEPSPTDLSLCVTPALMVICSGAGDCRAWWLPEGAERQAQPPRLVPWRMGDGSPP